MKSGIIYTIGIDPGVTTGWAIIGVPRDTIYDAKPGKISHFETGEFTGPFAGQVRAICHMARHHRWRESKNNLTIVVEDFDIHKANRSVDYTSPIRIGAMLEYAICVGHAGDVTGPQWQMPALAMQTATDQRLKAWELYQAGSEHRKDATRHAITWIRRAKADETLRRRGWGL